eukprot:3272960-Prymnesium_polylepis.1
MARRLRAAARAWTATTARTARTARAMRAARCAAWPLPPRPSDEQRAHELTQPAAARLQRLVRAAGRECKRQSGRIDRQQTGRLTQSTLSTLSTIAVVAAIVTAIVAGSLAAVVAASPAAVVAAAARVDQQHCCLHDANQPVLLDRHYRRPCEQLSQLRMRRQSFVARRRLAVPPPRSAHGAVHPLYASHDGAQRGRVVHSAVDPTCVPRQPPAWLVLRLGRDSGRCRRRRRRADREGGANECGGLHRRRQFDAHRAHAAGRIDADSPQR